MKTRRRRKRKKKEEKEVEEGNQDGGAIEEEEEEMEEACILLHHWCGAKWMTPSHSTLKSGRFDGCYKPFIPLSKAEFGFVKESDFLSLFFPNNRVFAFALPTFH